MMRRKIVAGATALSLLAGVAWAADNFAIDNATGTFTVIRCTDTAGVCTLNAILAAGSALIGTVAIDQTTPGTTNAVSATNFPTTAALGHGTAATALRVELPTDGTGVVGLNAGTATIGGTIPKVGTTGGATPYFVQPTASDNHAVIKDGAGTVYGIVATNNSVTINYLRLYNLGTGFNGCNSATGLLTQVAILPSGGVSASLGAAGMAFSTGLSICVTSGYATTDTTNATASAMSVTVLYN